MLPEEALDLFRRQHGLAATFQLRDRLDPPTRRRVARHPEVETVTPRVRRHRAVAPKPEQQVLAAVLDAGRGGILWGKSGASWWGFGRFPSGCPHVGVSRTSLRGTRLGQVHLIRDLATESVTSHLGVPVSRPEETVLWLAGMWTHRFGVRGFELAVAKTARNLDHAWRMGLIDGARIHDVCARSGGRGRSGIRVLRAVLETRPPEYRPSGSALEDRFESTLPADLRGRLERQVAVGDQDRIGVVDYRYRPLPLLLEINGEVFHSSLTDRAADEERYRRLVAAGFAVMVVWEYDVFHQPHRIVDALRAFEAAPFEPRVIRPTTAPWETW